MDFALQCKIDRPTLESIHVFVLSCTWTHESKWARSCSISLALKGRLRQKFKPTLPTFSILRIHILDANQIQTKKQVPPGMPS